MAHDLHPLPYARDALEPHLSAETIDDHYGKHHQKYVTKLNQLTEGGEHADQTLEQIIADACMDAFWKLVNWRFVEARYTST